MKSILTLCITILYFTLSSQTTPPDKLCYDYDKAGNRIGQNPAWLNPNAPPDYLPDCTPNDPDSYIGSIFKIFVVRISSIDNELPHISSKSSSGFVPVISSTESSSLIADGALSYIYSDFMPLSIDNNSIIYAELVQNVLKKEPDSIFDIELSIIPNPNIGRFQVKQNGFDIENSFILIYDSKGGLLFNRKYDKGEVSIGEYAVGSYILVLTDGTRQKTVRFTKKE